MLEEFPCRYHISQISSLKTISVIKRAKEEGLKFSTGVSINNLSLNENDIGDFKTFLKLSPPLRTENYRLGLVNAINQNLEIHHLIYPIPDGFGLGSHLTLEMDNSIKFGPDVEWVESPQDYAVDISRKQTFIKEIREYLPSIDTSLLTPAYAGIRPITNKMHKAMRDFEISDVNHHRIKNLINLFGIDSPGLTSSLSIAKYISDKLI